MYQVNLESYIGSGVLHEYEELMTTEDIFEMISESRKRGAWIGENGVEGIIVPYEGAYLSYEKVEFEEGELEL